jgi:hypothetical protein
VFQELCKLESLLSLTPFQGQDKNSPEAVRVKVITCGQSIVYGSTPQQLLKYNRDIFFLMMQALKQGTLYPVDTIFWKSQRLRG